PVAQHLGGEGFLAAQLALELVRDEIRKPAVPGGHLLRRQVLEYVMGHSCSSDRLIITLRTRSLSLGSRAFLLRLAWPCFTNKDPKYASSGWGALRDRFGPPHRERAFHLS